ncbi:hypothetical protein DT076_16580 [Desertihabitans brevis]|uniref:Uncharacterized protein n=1 Tax=Desertihabitans brevis TaxID=2268447 RepID=A0A367YR13_9ACTN|nr:hypothetical protein [Desertihabitans brevis]RCK68264.1 hypothetical protein DT076_16580 [Desertihabitans brevis]
MRGWEPRQRTTVTSWDDEGRPTEWVTTREPEYNADDLAWFHALAEYEADLHTCGRPLSESLKREGHTGPKYVVGEAICRACMALDSHLAKRAAADKAIRDKGFHPEAYRQYSIHTEDEMAAIVAAQQLHSEHHD